MISQPYVKAKFTHYIDQLTKSQTASESLKRMPVVEFPLSSPFDGGTLKRSIALRLSPPAEEIPPVVGVRFSRYIPQRLLADSSHDDVDQVVSTGINVLPDDVLLEIFYFGVGCGQSIQAWESLVHVCRRWRGVIFGSPRRLNLQILCTSKTPARDMLDIWPALPLHIRDGHHDLGEQRLDNIIAAFERRDRVREINITHISISYMKKLSEAMKEPFPGLTSLNLWSYGTFTLPDSFLGGSSPRLRDLSLSGVPFPGLPKLLLSATLLVNLCLRIKTLSDSFSPQAMLTALSTLTRLDSLKILFYSEMNFHFPQPHLDRESRHPPLATRSVLSVLTRFSFEGKSEYLDDLVAYIDAPRLYKLNITFFDNIIFDTPQLIQFICRTPTLKPLTKAYLSLDSYTPWGQLALALLNPGILRVGIACKEQIPSIGQTCTSYLPPLSTLDDLYIFNGQLLGVYWRDNIKNVLWLELLRPFGAVKNLYIAKEIAPCIVPVLQEVVGSRATEVLPALQNIFLEGLEPSGRVQEGIRHIVATRQVTSSPILVSRWDR